MVEEASHDLFNGNFVILTFIYLCVISLKMCVLEGLIFSEQKAIFSVAI